MKKNFPWLVAFFFFLVAVAALLAPEYRHPKWQPALGYEEFVQRSLEALPEPDFILTAQREDGGIGEGFVLYECDFEQRDSMATADYSKLISELIRRLEPQTRSTLGGNFFMHADDRFVRIELLQLTDQKVRFSYLEVYHW